MYLTIKIFLLTSESQNYILRSYGKCFRDEIERIVHRYEKLGRIVFMPYKWISSDIAFHSKSQVIHFSETLYKKRSQQHEAVYSGCFSSMAKSVQVTKDQLTFSFGKSFSVPRLKVKVNIHEQQWKRLMKGELVKVDVKETSQGFFANILVSMPNPTGIARAAKERAMGVDIGMRCPAVCYTCDGVIRFIGNGREIRYHIRRLNNKIRKSQKDGTIGKKKNNHQLQNYKRYIDHCISKDIVTMAVEQNIQVIYLENLYHLQKKFTRHEQICWSYARLQHYIAYKAELEGIHVRYVNPKLTSKRCPACGKINNVKGRIYSCRCGFHHHRDVVGAMNILHAPEILL